MRTALRTLTFLLGTSASILVAHAQPLYTLIVEGTITGCTNLQQVNIASTPGSVPSYNYTLEVAPNACFYDTILHFNSPAAGVVVTTMCGGMVLTATDTALFNGVLDTATVVLNFNCGGQPLDCLGVPGGSALPGTACTTFLGLPGTWTANCECVANAPSCEACFTTAPLMGDTLPVAFTAVFNNCSSGGAPPFSYNWTFPGGVVSAQQSPLFTFPGPGQYQVCLDIADANGCTSTICNDITVNAFGGINTIFPAPPYPLIVHVDMTMCDPGTTATISSGAGAQPPYSFTVPLDADCSWLDTLWMTSPAGSVSVTLSCDPMGSINTQYFDFNLGVGGLGFFYSGCPNPVFDCLQIPNGPNLPGTPCQVPGTILQGLWSANCVCEPDTNATGCQAGFWVIQAYEPDSLNPGSATPIPYELWVWNLSTGTSPFQFEWDFGDGTSSFDPYPTHVYGASGPYTLCLTLSDAASCSSIYCDEVSIDGDGFYEGMAPENEVRNGFTIRVLNQLPAAVPEQRFDDSRVWPNPVTDALNLSFRSTESGNVPVRIIDLNGRVIRQESLAFVRGANTTSLNAADLPAGLYLLRVGNDTNTMNIRFVKQ